MTLLVDTSVWSLAFRRDGEVDGPEVEALRAALLAGDRLVTTGVIVQELLQGFHGPRQADRLLERLRSIAVLRPTLDDHVRAAGFRDDCRRRRVALATIDALIVSLCVGYELTLLTCDQDFVHAATVVPLELWAPAL